MKQISLLLLFSLCFTLSSFAQIDPSPHENLRDLPEPQGYVNDFADVLSDKQEYILEKRLEAYELNSSREIAIVTLNSMYDYGDIAPLATDLSNAWGLGQDSLNNGLMILIVPSARQMRISTGYGTEQKLSDQICAQVLNTYMIPFFKDNDFYAGILSGLAVLQDRWGAPSEQEQAFMDAQED